SSGRETLIRGTSSAGGRISFRGLAAGTYHYRIWTENYVVLQGPDARAGVLEVPTDSEIVLAPIYVASATVEGDTVICHYYFGPRGVLRPRASSRLLRLTADRLRKRFDTPLVSTILPADPGKPPQLEYHAFLEHAGWRSFKLEYTPLLERPKPKPIRVSTNHPTRCGLIELVLPEIMDRNTMLASRLRLLNLEDNRVELPVEKTQTLVPAGKYVLSAQSRVLRRALKKMKLTVAAGDTASLDIRSAVAGIRPARLELGDSNGRIVPAGFVDVFDGKAQIDTIAIPEPERAFCWFPRNSSLRLFAWAFGYDRTEQSIEVGSGTDLRSFRIRMQTSID
ncbi:MAG: hypothetical protein ACE5F1_07715, partial [Planctomycetota bacterium]